jgi:curved DNA-binding protein CbpA
LDSKGYYAILGVSERAKYTEIRAAYRLLAKKYHPDRNNSDFAEDIIKKINAAFEVLSNRDKRREYDQIVFDNDRSHKEDKLVGEDSDNNNMKHNYYQVYSNQSSSYHHDLHENIKINNNNNGDLGTELRTQSTDRLDPPKARFHLIVDPSLCMAFGSCETLAPKVFVVEQNKILNPKAIVKSETGADFDMILAAAQTCPTKAIKIMDRYTGEQIYP